MTTKRTTQRTHQRRDRAIRVSIDADEQRMTKFAHPLTGAALTRARREADARAEHHERGFTTEGAAEASPAGPGIEPQPGKEATYA